MLASLSRRSARVSPATAQQRCLARPITLAPRSRPAVQAVRAQAAFSAPPVSETKKKFLNAFSKPIPAIYSTVIFELLVQQHFVRYNKNYAYNPIFALGFVSVFEQILDSLPEDDRKNIFNAYVRSLSEDPEQYRKDAALLEQTASSLSGPDGLTPDASGSDLQKALASVAESASAGNFAYNKFFAIGLFRLLELTGAKEPAALERLVKSVNVKTEAVNRDLMMYKNILSKLSAAKELMKEFLERERRKNAERLEERKKKEEAAALAADSNATVQA